jgi:hypothetical protein
MICNQFNSVFNGSSVSGICNQLNWDGWGEQFEVEKKKIVEVFYLNSEW